MRFAAGAETVLEPAAPGDGAVVNLAAAALLAVGLADDIGLLGTPGLLVAPQHRRSGWSDGV